LKEGNQMAQLALMQKLQYHAKKSGLTIRKIADNYVIADVRTKNIVTGFLTFEQLKEKILALQIKKLEKSFA
jgi:aryl-alcohol dehydrogenase-like predicted oxidoreductase